MSEQVLQPFEIGKVGASGASGASRGGAFEIGQNAGRETAVRMQAEWKSTQPDLQAAVQLADRYGVKLPEVEANFSGYMERARVDEMAEMFKAAPRLRTAAEDPALRAGVQFDMPALAGLEHAVRGEAPAENEDATWREPVNRREREREAQKQERLWRDEALARHRLHEAGQMLKDTRPSVFGPETHPFAKDVQSVRAARAAGAAQKELAAVRAERGDRLWTDKPGAGLHRALRKGAQGLAAAYAGLSQALWEKINAILPAGWESDKAAMNAALYDQLMEEIESYPAEDVGWLAQMGYKFVESIPQMLPIIAGGLSGASVPAAEVAGAPTLYLRIAQLAKAEMNPASTSLALSPATMQKIRDLYGAAALNHQASWAAAMATAAAGAEIYGSTYGDLRRAGAEPYQAAPAAAANAAVQGLMEGWSFKKLFGFWKASGLGNVAKAAVQGAFTEFATEAMQTAPEEFFRWIGKAGTSENETLRELAGRMPEILRDALEEGLIGAAWSPLLGAGAYRAMARRERMLKQHLAYFEGVQAGAEKSKLRDAAPDMYEALAERFSQDAPVKEIFVTTEGLQKAAAHFGQDLDAFLESHGVSREAFDEAEKTGADVSVPIAEWNKRFAGKEEGMFLLAHSKSDPEGRGAKERDWGELERWAQDDWDAVIKGSKLEAEITDLLKPHRETLVSGGFTEAEADAYFKIVAAGARHAAEAATASGRPMTAADWLRENGPDYEWVDSWAKAAERKTSRKARKAAKPAPAQEAGDAVQNAPEAKAEEKDAPETKAEPEPAPFDATPDSGVLGRARALTPFEDVDGVLDRFGDAQTVSNNIQAISDFIRENGYEPRHFVESEAGLSKTLWAYRQRPELRGALDAAGLGERGFLARWEAAQRENALPRKKKAPKPKKLSKTAAAHAAVAESLVQDFGWSRDEDGTPYRDEAGHRFFFIRERMKLAVYDGTKTPEDNDLRHVCSTSAVHIADHLAGGIPAAEHARGFDESIASYLQWLEKQEEERAEREKAAQEAQAEEAPVQAEQTPEPDVQAAHEAVQEPEAEAKAEEAAPLSEVTDVVQDEQSGTEVPKGTDALAAMVDPATMAAVGAVSKELEKLDWNVHRWGASLPQSQAVFAPIKPIQTEYRRFTAAIFCRRGTTFVEVQRFSDDELKDSASAASKINNIYKDWVHSERVGLLRDVSTGVKLEFNPKTWRWEKPEPTQPRNIGAPNGRALNGAQAEVGLASLGTAGQSPAVNVEVEQGGAVDPDVIEAGVDVATVDAAKIMGLQAPVVYRTRYAGAPLHLAQADLLCQMCGGYLAQGKALGRAFADAFPEGAPWRKFGEMMLAATSAAWQRRFLGRKDVPSLMEIVKSAAEGGMLWDPAQGMPEWGPNPHRFGHAMMMARENADAMSPGPLGRSNLEEDIIRYWREKDPLIEYSAEQNEVGVAEKYGWASSDPDGWFHTPKKKRERAANEAEKLIVSKERVREHGEVYTPMRVVRQMSDLAGDEIRRIGSRVLDPACGNGNFLVEALHRKMQSVAEQAGRDEELFHFLAAEALSSVYGVEILADNVKECRARLLSTWKDEIADAGMRIPPEIRLLGKFLLERNIVRGDTLKMVHPDTEEPVVLSEWRFNAEDRTVGRVDTDMQRREVVGSYVPLPFKALPFVELAEGQARQDSFAAGAHAESDVQVEPAPEAEAKAEAAVAPEAFRKSAKKIDKLLKKAGWKSGSLGREKEIDGVLVRLGISEQSMDGDMWIPSQGAGEFKRTYTAQEIAAPGGEAIFAEAVDADAIDLVRQYKESAKLAATEGASAPTPSEVAQATLNEGIERAEDEIKETHDACDDLLSVWTSAGRKLTEEIRAEARKAYAEVIGSDLAVQQRALSFARGDRETGRKGLSLSTIRKMTPAEWLRKRPWEGKKEAAPEPVQEPAQEPVQEPAQEPVQEEQAPEAEAKAEEASQQAEEGEPATPENVFGWLGGFGWDTWVGYERGGAEQPVDLPHGKCNVCAKADSMAPGRPFDVLLWIEGPGEQGTKRWFYTETQRRIRFNGREEAQDVARAIEDKAEEILGLVPSLDLGIDYWEQSRKKPDWQKMSAIEAALEADNRAGAIIRLPFYDYADYFGMPRDEQERQARLGVHSTWSMTFPGKAGTVKAVEAAAKKSFAGMSPKELLLVTRAARPALWSMAFGGARKETAAEWIDRKGWNDNVSDLVPEALSSSVLAVDRPAASERDPLGAELREYGAAPKSERDAIASRVREKYGLDVQAGMASAPEDATASPDAETMQEAASLAAERDGTAESAMRRIQNAIANEETTPEERVQLREALETVERNAEPDEKIAEPRTEEAPEAEPEPKAEEASPQGPKKEEAPVGRENQGAEDLALGFEIQKRDRERFGGRSTPLRKWQWDILDSRTNIAAAFEKKFHKEWNKTFPNGAPWDYFADVFLAVLENRFAAIFDPGRHSLREEPILGAASKGAVVPHGDDMSVAKERGLNPRGSLLDAYAMEAIIADWMNGKHDIHVRAMEHGFHAVVDVYRNQMRPLADEWAGKVAAERTARAEQEAREKARRNMSASERAAENLQAAMERMGRSAGMDSAGESASDWVKNHVIISSAPIWAPEPKKEQTLEEKYERFKREADRLKAVQAGDPDMEGWRGWLPEADGDLARELYSEAAAWASLHMDGWTIGEHGRLQTEAGGRKWELKLVHPYSAELRDAAGNVAASIRFDRRFSDGHYASTLGSALRDYIEAEAERSRRAAQTPEQNLLEDVGPELYEAALVIGDMEPVGYIKAMLRGLKVNRGEALRHLSEEAFRRSMFLWHTRGVSRQKSLGMRAATEAAIAKAIDEGMSLNIGGSAVSGEAAAIGRIMKAAVVEGWCRAFAQTGHVDARKTAKDGKPAWVSMERWVKEKGWIDQKSYLPEWAPDPDTVAGMNEMVRGLIDTWNAGFAKKLPKAKIAQVQDAAVAKRAERLKQEYAERQAAGQEAASPQEETLSQIVRRIEGKRGEVTFHDPLRSAKATISLLSGAADMSTLVHELGHVFMKDMELLVKSGKAPERIVQDWNALVSFGKSKAAEWHDSMRAEGAPAFASLRGKARAAAERVAMHEVLAEAWLDWMRKGNAPTKALARAFSSFKGWLQRIHDSLRQLKEDGTEVFPGFTAPAPEVEAVFARMLTSEQDIAEAEAQSAMSPAANERMDEAIGDGLTPEQKEELRKLREETSREARDQASADAVGRMEDAERKAKAQEETVRRDVGREPLYAAAKAAVEAGGLDRESILRELWDAFGSGGSELLARFEAVPGLVAASGGVDARLAGVGNGFEEGAWVRQFAQAPGIEDAVKARLFAIQEAEEARQEAEAEPMGGRKRRGYDFKKLRVFELEVEGLLKKAGLSVNVYHAEEIQEAAREMVGKMPVSRALGVKRLIAAERRNAAEAARYVAEANHMLRGTAARAVREEMDEENGVGLIRQVAGKGKLKRVLKKAAMARMRQMLSHAIVVEAIGFSRRKAVLERRILNRHRHVISTLKEPPHAWEYQEQLRALAQRFHVGGRNRIAPLRPDKLRPVREFVKAEYADATLGEPPYPEWLLTDEVTLDSIREQAAARGGDLQFRVADWYDMAALAHWLLRNGPLGDPEMASGLFAGRNRDEVVKECVDALKESGNKFTPKQEGSLGRKVQDGLSKLVAGIINAEYRFMAADGYREAGMNSHVQGPHSRLFRAIREGEAAAQDEYKKARPELEELQEVRERFMNRFRKEYGKPEEINGIPVPEIDRAVGRGYWTDEMIWCIARNLGNAGNIRTLAAGHGLSLEQSLSLTSILTAEEWNAVRRECALVERFYDACDAAFFKVYGMNMAGRVPPRPFLAQCADGTVLDMPGWYFPIAIDRALDPDGARNDAADMLKDNPDFQMFGPAMKKGFSHARTGTKKPCALKYGVFEQALWDQWRFIHMAPIIKDADRITRHKDWKDAFTAAFGKPAYEEIRAWLKFSARPVKAKQQPLVQLLEKFRVKSTVFYLALNLNTSLRQFGGLPQAVPEIGGAYVLRGLGVMLGAPRQTWSQVNEMSAFMRNRDKNFTRDLRDFTAKAYERGKLFRVGGYTVTEDDVQQAAMYPVTTCDRITTYSVWMGAHMRAADMGMSPADAVAYADHIVSKTQATAMPEDVNAWQREDGVPRFLCMFMSETFRKHARLNYYFNGWRAGKIPFSTFFSAAFWNVFGASMIYVALRALFTASTPDEEDLAWALFDEAMGPLPIINGLVGRMRYGTRMSEIPALRGFDILSQPFLDLKKIAGDYENPEGWNDLLKHAVDILAFLAGTGNARRVYETAAKEWPELAEGESRNPFRLFLKPYGEDER